MQTTSLRDRAYNLRRLLSGMPKSDLINWEKIALINKVLPYTMLDYPRLACVYDLAQDIEKQRLEGSFVECGVWRGGCASILAYVANKFKNNRKIHLFDSFEGLPEPTMADGNMAEEYASGKLNGTLESISKCVGSIEDVQSIMFSQLSLPEQNIVFHKGWFQDTLPLEKDKIGKIAILRLDGDWYESTKVCLDNLYDQVVQGGYVIIDDYGFWEGCRKAVDEFMEKRNIAAPVIWTGKEGVYFKKP